MDEDKHFKLNGRIWIESESGRLFGKGRIELLERIQNSGSIRQAALQMKMSYRQAWDLVEDMNQQMEKPVVISQRGGKGGGNAIVTEQGEKAIEQFYLFQKKFEKFLKLNSSKIQF